MHFWHIGPTEYAAIKLPLYDAMWDYMERWHKAQEQG